MPMPIFMHTAAILHISSKSLKIFTPGISIYNVFYVQSNHV